MTAAKKYFKRVFIAFSILVNSVLGGSNNQTFSARNWERKRNHKINLVWLIDKVFFLQKDHCQLAWVKWTIISNAVSRYTEVMGYQDLTSRNLWD